MTANKLILAGVCLAAAILSVPRPTPAQNCASAPNAAVECFMGNAVHSNLLTLQFGMTLAQFKTYGVSVSKIVQTPTTSLAAVVLASAVADAMPATNADGSANAAAQTAAMNAIVDAAVANNFMVLPADTTSQDMKWFSLDLLNAMNTPNGIVLSPGTMLRMIDSYVVSSTTNGTVNWTPANAGIATMMTNLASSGLLKLPPTIAQAQSIQFAQSLAQAIATYKTATGRTSL
jgi:hypothetical protein